MPSTPGASQAKQDTTELESRGKALKEGIGGAEKQLAEVEVARDAALAHIGNLVHDSVPVDDDEVRGQGGTTLFPHMQARSSVCARTFGTRGRQYTLSSAARMAPTGLNMPPHLSLAAISRPAVCLTCDDRLAKYHGLLWDRGGRQPSRAGCTQATSRCAARPSMSCS